MARLGIDIGGSSIKVGVFVNGKLKAAFSNPTHHPDGREDVLRLLYCAIASASKGITVDSIGVVSAGDIDIKTGTITRAINIKGWTGCPLKTLLENKYKVRVDVDNDAVGALMGERSVLPIKDNITMLTFKTGVGGASLINGSISRDAKTTWGHRTLVKDGRPCICGGKGCAEAYLSATALSKDAEPIFGRHINTFEILKKYWQQDERAVLLINNFAFYLNMFLKQIDKEIHPDMIVLGGGLMSAKESWRPLIKYDPSRYCFASLDNRAGIVGANLLPF